MAISRLFQWTLGRLPALDIVGSVPGYELGNESGGNGGFGELFEEGGVNE
jgi:hypothetical protein